MESSPAKDAHAAVKDSPICTEINTIVVSVRDVNDKLIEKQWACAVGSGTITGVAPGPIVLTVKGFQADGTGHKTNFYKSTEYRPVIEAGKKKEMGTIALGLTTDQDDWDGGGYTPVDGDCDDSDSGIHKGQTDDCTDEVDQDCDPTTCVPRVWYYDLDNDGFGNPDPDLAVYRVVRPDDYVSNSDDCDDNFESINPEGTETPYDGIDQDCLDGDLVDVDHDGYAAEIAGGPDRDDNNAAINPGVEEVCGDQIDNNSNGVVDDGCPWNKTFRMNGLLDDEALAVIQANGHDGYVIAGYTLFQTPPFLRRPWIMKIDEEGNQLWRVSPEVSLGGRSNPDLSIVQAHDSGYVMAGSIGIVKVGEDGSIVEEWNKTYGDNSSDHFRAIIQSPDGGYVVVGELYSESTQSQDLWFLKVDANGNEIDGFNKTFVLGSDSDDRAIAVETTCDGGYIIAGLQGDSNAWIIKIDDKGNEKWRKDLGTGTGACSVVQDKDCGYVVAGPIGELGPSRDAVLGSTFTWLRKFNEEGNELWFKYIPDPHYLYPDQLPSILTSLTLANDGQYVVSGNGQTGGSFLLKTGADADPMKWRKEFVPNDSTDNLIYSVIQNSVIQSNDQRGYILAGMIRKDIIDPLYGPLTYVGHASLIKTDENGNAPEFVQASE